jgi:hypothetical protein
MDHFVYCHSAVNSRQPAAAREFLVQVVIQVRGLHKFEMEKTGAAGIIIPAATGETLMTGGHRGFQVVGEAFVFSEMGFQVNQVASFQGGFTHGQLFFFFAELSEEPPLVKARKFGARFLELLFGQFEAEAASQEVGGDKGACPADSVCTVNQNLFAQVQRFVEPIQSLFQFVKSRSLVVIHGEIIDFETVALLDLMEIGVLTAKVDNTVNALVTDGLKFIVGHGRMSDSQLLCDPIQGIMSHRFLFRLRTGSES